MSGNVSSCDISHTLINVKRGGDVSDVPWFDFDPENQWQRLSYGGRGVSDLMD